MDYSDSEDDFALDNDEDFYESFLDNRKNRENQKGIPEPSEELFDIENMEVLFLDGPENANIVENYVAEDVDYTKLCWTNAVFAPSEAEFKGNSALPGEILKLETPLSFFTYLLTPDIIEDIAQQSNLYASQRGDFDFSVTPLEILRFIGVCFMTSVIQIPCIRRYWHPTLGNSIVQGTMSINRFETIRRYMHFANSEDELPKEHPDCDRAYKIRNLMEKLKVNFQKVPLEEHLSVDEQICSSKARVYFKQYMPLKPKKWGFKFFPLCGAKSGYVYNFELYTGNENNPKFRLSNEKDLGACANVVVRLLRDVPNYLNHKVYFDNYYTNIPLVYELHKRGIRSLGTVRKNRIKNIQLPDTKFWKKSARGTMYEVKTTINSTDICVVQWKDNKIVTCASDFVGTEPIETVRRRSKEELNLMIPAPAMIKFYNSYMGGVDLVDSMIARHKILLKSKKWYIRIFHHLLDLTMCNAWILYK